MRSISVLLLCHVAVDHHTMQSAPHPHQSRALRLLDAAAVLNVECTTATADVPERLLRPAQYASVRWSQPDIWLYICNNCIQM